MTDRKSCTTGLVAMLLPLLSACGGGDPPPVETVPAKAGEPAWISMGEDLEELRSDFNGAAETVRLVYLVGPSCGVCLRGMVDLERELRAVRDDARLQTFVVHQPTLGATEAHVGPAVALLEGPNIRHYWEESGIIGNHYAETLGLRSGDDLYYAWDIWMIYGPGATWEDVRPPMPDFTMHQLSVMTEKFNYPYLDARRFAKRAVAALSEPVSLPAPPPAVGRTVTLDDIAQPASAARRQALMSRGGYHNFTAITGERWHGRLRTGGREAPIEIRVTRDAPATLGTPGPATVIDAESDAQWLAAFELASPLMDWAEKGHTLEDALSMERLGEHLAWVATLDHKSGLRWSMLIDSHSGHELERRLHGEQGEVRLSITFEDYRPLSDFPLDKKMVISRHREIPLTLTHYVYPHQVTFRDPHGQTLAEITLDRIDLLRD